MNPSNQFEKVFISGSNSVLVAGDSNVHRIKNAFSDVDDAFVHCLPVSGARYTYDRKMFREQLKASLKEVSYTLLYLFLGSNDVLSPEHIFYRNVTEMCDMVHETSPETQVVLCAIPPRAPNQKNCAASGGKLKMMQEWIKQANVSMDEIGSRIPYVRFFETHLNAHHLSLDGLHLSKEGADVCYREISRDSITHGRPSYHNLPVLFAEDSWPSLTNQGTEIDKRENNSISYADIARKNIKFEKTVRSETDVNSMQKKCLREQKGPYVRNRQLHSFECGRKRWLKKKE